MGQFIKYGRAQHEHELHRVVPPTWVSFNGVLTRGEFVEQYTERERGLLREGHHNVRSWSPEAAQFFTTCEDLRAKMGYVAAIRFTTVHSKRRVCVGHLGCHAKVDKFGHAISRYHHVVQLQVTVHLQQTNSVPET